MNHIWNLDQELKDLPTTVHQQIKGHFTWPVEGMHDDLKLYSLKLGEQVQDQQELRPSGNMNAAMHKVYVFYEML